MDSNRYNEMRPLRDAERAAAILRGEIRDPTKAQRLDQAVKLRGTCADMCPEFERHQREYDNSTDRWERIPGTMRIDPLKAVKAFHRPAAGNEDALPSDVRPPPVLQRTLDYLFNELLPVAPLFETHGFIRDRTRAIRQDFTVQNERGLEAIECHERIARYHIMCLHDLHDKEGLGSYQEAQELEQLRKVLQSLNEFYDDLPDEAARRKTSEAEFRAYHLLTHIRDADVLRSLESLPPFLFDDPRVRVAVDLCAMAQRSNMPRGRNAANSDITLNAFSRFFKRVAGPDVSFLQSATLEPHFRQIVIGGIKAISRSQAKYGQTFPVARLATMTKMEDDVLWDLLRAIKCEPTRDGRGVATVDLFRRHIDESGGQYRMPQCSLVSRKRPADFARILDGSTTPRLSAGKRSGLRTAAAGPSPKTSPPASVTPLQPTARPVIPASAPLATPSFPPLKQPPAWGFISPRPPVARLTNGLLFAASGEVVDPQAGWSPGPIPIRAQARASAGSDTSVPKRPITDVSRSSLAMDPAVKRLASALISAVVVAYARRASEDAALASSGQHASSARSAMTVPVSTCSASLYQKLSVGVATDLARLVALETVEGAWSARCARARAYAAWQAWHRVLARARQSRDETRHTWTRFRQLTLGLLPNRETKSAFEDPSYTQSPVIGSTIWAPGELASVLGTFLDNTTTCDAPADMIALLPGSAPVARAWLCCQFGMSNANVGWVDTGPMRVRVADVGHRLADEEMASVALIAVWRSEQEDFKSQTRAWLDQATRASRWRPIIVSVGWAAGHDLTKADVEQAGPAFTRALRAHATSGFRLKQEQFATKEPWLSAWSEAALSIARMPEQDPQNRRVLLARATALLLDAFDADFGTQWSEGDAAKCLRQACSKLQEHPSPRQDGLSPATLEAIVSATRLRLDAALTDYSASSVQMLRVGDKASGWRALALLRASFRELLHTAEARPSRRRKRSLPFGVALAETEASGAGRPPKRPATGPDVAGLRALVSAVRQR